MKLSELRDIAASQKEAVETFDTGLEREALAGLPDITSHALIVCGIRRCGKNWMSTSRLSRPARMHRS